MGFLMAAGARKDEMRKMAELEVNTDLQNPLRPTN